jgi:hypothetical protein
MGGRRSPCVLAGHGGEEDMRGAGGGGEGEGAQLWLAVYPGQLWRRGEAASSCGGSAWRGGGVVGAMRLILSSLYWLLGGGSFSKVGVARRLARKSELLSDDFAETCPVASSKPQGSRATASAASLLPSRRSLAASSQVACSPMALRWPVLGDLVGFLEKSYSA